MKKTYPVADVYSDHKPLVKWIIYINIRTKLKKPKCKSKKQPIDVRKLKEPDVPQRTKQRVNNNLINTQGNHEVSIINGEILHLMDERRRNKNRAKYKELSLEINIKIKKAKENWIKHETTELYERQYHNFNMYKKIK